MGRLSGKVAIVTGGALGIGRACCLRMAEEGASVAVTDIEDAEGEKLVSEIKAAGGTAGYWHLDVTAEPEVERVCKEVADTYGSLSVMVANAGIAGANRPTHELSVEEWNQVMAVNVTGVFLCTKHAIPYMRQAGGGSIVNLSSIYGLISAPDIPPYHASKGAVRLMSKTDALLYATEGIRVNSVHPGYIWTPLVDKLGQSLGFSEEEFRAELGSRHPVGHVGEPDDIAWGVVYLASDESKFVTGTELVIDGGYVAR